MESYKQKKRVAWRIFWGIVFLLAAAAIVVNALGIGLFAGIGTWQLIVSVLCVLVLIAGLTHLAWFGVFFPLAVLGILFDKLLHIEQLTPWPILGVALFLSIAFSILFHRKKPWNEYKNHWQKKEGNYTERGHHKDAFEREINTEDESYVHLEQSFGSTIKYVNSDNFIRGEFHSSFGALKIYFDNTTPAEGAVIDVHVSFGAIELYVPKEWRLIDNISTNLSGVSERNPRSYVGNGPTVTMTGTTSFSGVEITYV